MEFWSLSLNSSVAVVLILLQPPTRDSESTFLNPYQNLKIS